VPNFACTRPQSDSLELSWIIQTTVKPVLTLPLHSTQSYAQLLRYSICSTPFPSKISVNLLLQKLSIECWWNWHLGSISSTFYSKLLCEQILKAQKKTHNLTVFFAPLESVHVKAACKTLVKLTPDFTIFFYVQTSQDCQGQC